MSEIFNPPPGTMFTTQSANLAGGTRLINTNYQNLSGKTMCVSVLAYVTNPVAGTWYGLAGYSKVSSPADTLVFYDYAPSHGGTGDEYHTAVFLVPNNYYYRVAGPGMTLGYWVEYT